MTTKNTTLTITLLGGLTGGAGNGAASADAMAQKVLFIHGFGADKQGWVGNAPALFDIAAVQALDLPGHGDSYTLDTSADLQAIADSILACIDTANEAPTHIVAHSLGAAVAMLCAVARPGLVASLTLIAPVGLGQGVSAGFTRAFVNLDNEESALQLLQSLVHNPRLIPAMLATMLLEKLARPGARVALGNIAIQLHGSNKLLNETVTQLKNTEVNYQVIWGLQDNINPPHAGDEAEFGGQWLWLDNCGHLPHIEHRVVVNDAIRDFIKNNSGVS